MKVYNTIDSLCCYIENKYCNKRRIHDVEFKSQDRLKTHQTQKHEKLVS